MIDMWLKEVKESADPEQLGMILVHNGIVRATTKDGKKVEKMKVTYDEKLLRSCVDEFSSRDGIVALKVWINEGILRVGDNIMYVLVAGRFRTDVLPTLQELLTKIKTEIINEEESVKNS